jgi:hypothetical protein
VDGKKQVLQICTSSSHVGFSAVVTLQFITQCIRDTLEQMFIPWSISAFQHFCVVQEIGNLEEAKEEGRKELSHALGFAFMKVYIFQPMPRIASLHICLVNTACARCGRFSTLTGKHVTNRILLRSRIPRSIKCQNIKSYPLMLLALISAIINSGLCSSSISCLKAGFDLQVVYCTHQHSPCDACIFC